MTVRSDSQRRAMFANMNSFSCKSVPSVKFSDTSDKEIDDVYESYTNKDMKKSIFHLINKDNFPKRNEAAELIRDNFADSISDENIKYVADGEFVFPKGDDISTGESYDITIIDITDDTNRVARQRKAERRADTIQDNIDYEVALDNKINTRKEITDPIIDNAVNIVNDKIKNGDFDFTDIINSLNDESGSFVDYERIGGLVDLLDSVSGRSDIVAGKSIYSGEYTSEQLDRIESMHRALPDSSFYHRLIKKRNVDDSEISLD